MDLGRFGEAKEGEFIGVIIPGIHHLTEGALVAVDATYDVGVERAVDHMITIKSVGVASHVVIDLDVVAGIVFYDEDDS